MIHPRSLSITCILTDSLDGPGDGGTAGDAGGFGGVLAVGVLPGGGMSDDFAGVDGSSVALFVFFLTLNKSRFGSKTMRPKITLNLTGIRIKNNTIRPFRYFILVLRQRPFHHSIVIVVKEFDRRNMRECNFRVFGVEDSGTNYVEIGDFCRVEC